MRPISLLVCGVALLGLIGCGPRVLHEQSWEIDPGQARGPVLQDLKKDTKISVEVSSPGTPVGVYLVLEKDEKAVLDALGAEKAPPNTLASEAKTEGKTLEVTMPERTGLVILIHNPPVNQKQASVKVKASRL
jgi:hypothetical protein